MPDKNAWEIVIIGGGHAGVEAAWAAARMLAGGRDGCGRGQPGRVALITMDPARIGVMSCNPAIGGLAKGQMVCEIAALGGLMGLAADATGIQFRMLNASKGSAVRGPRCQSDKYRYAAEVQRLLATQPNLDILGASVDELLVEEGRCVGVRITSEPEGITQVLRAGAVILTTGTFMRGLMHTGEHKTQGGRYGEKPAVTISDSLRRLGFELGRLKTGTPPRLAAGSLDLAELPEQPGDPLPTPFSAMTGHRQLQGPVYAMVRDRFPVLPQVHCWVTHTNPAIHDLIRANLDRAPMYNGQIETQGPRYCPSIEDKVVRFADRASHHVFLEPESLESDEIYCNGISTSLPADVQQQIVQSLPGCSRAAILRYGYAVEYDMVWPHQIDATAMSKRVAGLFLAGQINGTSGYEEAAGQGLVAAINAVHFSRGEDLLRLGRDQAYIGVLMDDLVTKTPREPYRMFTSRAEHRLLLRADNADERLTPLGRTLGLVDDARWDDYQARQRDSADLRAWIEQATADGAPLRRWLCRPQTSDADLQQQLPPPLRQRLAAHRGLLAQVVADYQYAGYIERARRDHARLEAMEHATLPTDLDYTTIQGLRTESARTLNHFRPGTLGQAGRLAGVNPADLMLISLALRRLAPPEKVLAEAG